MDTGVKEFYTGQSIFVTGATGFLGRVIIEKILRTCPDVKMLFLLIRAKKGKDSQQRIDELFDIPVFGPMKKETPYYRSKVTLITGDVSLPGLGMSDADRKIITNEVNIVFHGAATVRFDETLKKAIEINICGTQQVLEICSECKQLKALVHISTAYSNCNRQDIKEEVYNSPITIEDAIKLAKNIPEYILEVCTPMIISNWPNTYSFTKQIAEKLVVSQALERNIPTAVFRPAIVVGSYDEPVPGWIDNIYGPTGVICAVGTGILRVMPANYYGKMDLVPVDMTINAALAIAWDVALRNRLGKSEEDIVSVYNYVSAKQNRQTWGHLLENSTKQGMLCPTVKAVWCYTLTLTKNFPLFYILHFLYHLIPAAIVDGVLVATKRKPQGLMVYRKVQKFLSVISYFSCREWYFHDENVNNLWEKISDSDKRLFNFDMNIVDWERFFRNNLFGIRRFILQDPLDTIPAARRKTYIFKIFHWLIKVIFYSIVFWLLYLSMFRLLLHNWGLLV